MPLIIFRGAQGEVLGDKFRLIEQVGQGTFAEVWHAQRLSDGRHVALKVPKDQEKGDEILKKEPDLVKGLKHPNIVEVLDYHSIGHLFMIEMEFVDGYDLGHVLDGVNDRTPLSFEQMLLWMLDILNGLELVHERDISHNDLKPQNILIDRANNRARITDFGVSHRLEDVWVWTKRTGTEAYMAPEVAIEGKRGKRVSDLYSLGVLMYEMATGRLPYATPYQLMTTEAVAKPREINRNIPPELEAVILKAMDRRPEMRYQDCATMRRDIESMLALLRESQQAKAALARTTKTDLGFRPPSSSPLFYLELAKQRLKDDDNQGALEAAEAAVDRSDGHPRYLRMLGGICLRLGYRRKALDVYVRLLAAYDGGFPTEPQERQEVLARVAELYTELQRYQEAIMAYEELLRSSQGKVYWRFRLAITFGLNGEYDRAIELLEEVRREKPGAAIVHAKLGWAHALNGNDSLALSFYNQALVYDAFEVFSLFRLGEYYYTVGDRRRAGEYFRRVLECDREGSYASAVKKYLGSAA